MAASFDKDGCLINGSLRDDKALGGNLSRVVDLTGIDSRPAEGKKAA